MYRIGLISDTHGLLRPQALEALRGCDHIVHAGDVGDAQVLAGLSELAPVTAIRGNVDTGPWADALPALARVNIGGIEVYVVHELAALEIDPAQSGVDVVVSGHSHRPVVQPRDGVIYINPGSAGRRRFSLPTTVGEIAVDGRQITPRIIDLQLGEPAGSV